MDLEQLKKVLDSFREHELSELELENDGLRLKVRKEAAKPNQTTLAPAETNASSHSAAGSAGGGISKISAAGATSVPGSAAAAVGGAGTSGPAGAGAAEVTSMGAHGGVEEIGQTEVELAVVKSPIVGTFYRSTEPSSAPLVEIGSIVKKGQVLCIIEAMKLMNEIDSEYDGEIANVYVENGQPVQYGERLFAIRVR